MSSDPLDHRVIEVTRVTQEATGNVVGMLDPFEDIGGEGELRPLSKLSSLVLVVDVDVLHPAVVITGSSLGNVFLENNDVGVRDFHRVRGGDQRSNTFVDGLCAEGGCR